MHASFDITTAVQLATRVHEQQREIVAALVRGGNAVGEAFEPYTATADVHARVAQKLKCDPKERLVREQRILLQTRSIYQRVHRMRLLGATSVLLNEAEQDLLA